MLELRLHCENGFDDDVLHFWPDVSWSLWRRTLLRTGSCEHLTLICSWEIIRESQFVLLSIIVLSVLLVQAVVGQVNKHILSVALADIILFTGQSDQSILENEDGQRIHHTRHQNVYSEVKLVSIDQSRPLYVLLHHILGVFLLILRSVHKCNSSHVDQRRLSGRVSCWGSVLRAIWVVLLVLLNFVVQVIAVRHSVRVVHSCVVVLLSLNVVRVHLALLL